MDTLDEEVREEPVWKDYALSIKEFAVGNKVKNKLEAQSSPFADADASRGGSLTRRKIVKRDLKMAGETASQLLTLRKGMEDLRSDLMGYRDNVGWFRSGIVGYWAGGSSTDPEGEYGFEPMDVQVEMVSQTG